MLKTLIQRVRCPACQGALRDHVFVDGAEGHIHDGVLQCQDCNRWYPIDEDVLILTVPELQNPVRYRAFCGPFQQEMASLGLVVDDAVFAPRVDNQYAAQREQREHSDWFASNPELTYNEYAQTPFWRAVDELTFRRWSHMAADGDWVLDVGCANGRSTFRVARPGITVVGFDISEAMVRDAVRIANAHGLHGWTSFLVADADRLPFVDNQWDCAMTYGVLHHLPNPKASCAEIQRILKMHGLFLACENNDSVLRPVFDWLMRIFPLWDEKAGAEPLISDGMMHEWHIGWPVSIRARRRAYLPPHLFNLLGLGAACWLMKVTDAVGNSLPGIRNAAGLIFWEIRKNGKGNLANRGASGAP
jgi:SAM-dependent methyltransferase/uncharacterized protein YbaR (Trm112 family)